MSEFPFEIFLEGMKIVANKLSDREMEDHVRKMILDCLLNNPTPTQLYDMMAKVAALPCERSTKFCTGEISGFIQAYCDVTKHYKRP